MAQALPTKLDGVVLVAPAVHGDERGFFVETYSRDAWAELGVDAEFVVEQPPGVGVDAERLGLPPAAVEGEHQLGAQPFAQRVFGGERGQFGDHLGVAAQVEVELDAAGDQDDQAGGGSTHLQRAAGEATDNKTADDAGD